MQKIGEFLKVSRRQKGLTLDELSEETKIKKSFVKNIELEKWEALPEYPVLLGFIKNISSALDISQDKAIALFRRDYPPASKGTQIPSIAWKPKKQFRWGPKLTFLAISALALTVVFGYLVIQFVTFSRPPQLAVFEPTQNQVVTKRELKVIGKTDPGALVSVNNQPVLVADSGSFETILEIFEGTGQIEITAVSRSGKQSQVVRKIVPMLPKEDK